MSRDEYQYKNLRRVAEAGNRSFLPFLAFIVFGGIALAAGISDTEGDDVVRVLQENAGFTESAPSYATPIRDHYPSGELVVTPTPCEGKYCTAKGLVNSMFSRQYSKEEPIIIEAPPTPTTTLQIPQPTQAIIPTELSIAPQVVFDCHGKQIGETHPFRTLDENIGMGVVIMVDGIPSVKFRIQDVVFPCNQVTPHE